MKHLLTILSGLLVALLFARCADDDNLSGGIDGLPERGIVIRLSTGELDTRTQLTSTGDYHHVEEVWAVLYKLKDGADAETATEVDFEYKTHEKLDWSPMTEDEYGEGNPQGKEFLLHTDGTVLTNGTYRVLCIGLDDRSGAVYSLTNGNSSSSLQGFSSNKTLADALAVIRDKDCTELKPVGSQTSSLSDPGGDPSGDSDGDAIRMNGDPATAELFAGWEEFVFEEDNINIVEVVLKRRVAGILCYLTDVPLKVNYDGKEQYVTGIRLCLASPAATSISLCRKEGNPTEIEDFGTLDENGGTIPFENLTTLAYYQLPCEEQDYTITNTKETFQEGGETANYLMGVYMLPVKCTGEEILFVQLMIQDDEPTGNQGLATGLYLPDGVYNFKVGQPGPKFIVKESNSGKKDFDIRPNYIYHIGNKDDDTDEPVSLLGQELQVEAKVWEDEEIPVEFPSVPIFCTMELVNQYDVKYDQGYKFDCIGITDSEKDYGKLYSDKYDGESYTYQDYFPVRDRIRLNISPSVLGSKWKVSIDDESVGGGMLYFRDPLSSDDNPSYTKSYGPQTEAEWKSSKTLDIVLTDYVNKADYDAGMTQRKAIIQLETYDTGGNTVTHTEELEVVQYNAIMIPYGNKTLGFSHYDWSSDRGEYPDGVQTTWNYFNSTPTAGIFGNREERQTDGKKNYKNAKSYSTYNGTTVYNFYKQKDEAGTLKDGGCAIYKAGKKKVEIEKGTKSLANTVRWYLPAIDEIEAFFNEAKNVEGYYNIKKGTAKYWTSSTIEEALHNSRNIYLDSNGNVQKDDDGELYYGKNCSRKLLYYMRQVCVVGED